MSDTCIIYYHGNDYDGVPARQRYLMAALAAYVPVIYLDGTAEVRGRVTLQHPAPNITVVKGLASIIIALQRRRLDLLIKPVVSFKLAWVRRRYRRIIFWNAENWLRPYRFIPHNHLVFDCIDPPFSSTQDQKDLAAYAAREAQCLALADTVFASADLLVEACARERPDAILLNNACEPAEYTEQLQQGAVRPAWWPTSRAPIACYLGSLDWRFDFELMREVAGSLKEVHFVLAGSILSEFRGKVAELAALGNVTCPGRISVADGRYLLANGTVGLIPFTKSPANDAINPVKMYAYALLGKAIVGTDLHELRTRPEIAVAAPDAAAFELAVRAAVNAAANADPRAERRRAFALGNTWAHRAETAWKHLKNSSTEETGLAGVGSKRLVSEVGI